MALSLGGVGSSVYAPILSGHATDIIFSGVVSEHLAKGISQDQAVAAERAAGNIHLAKMFSRMRLAPGKGIDFRSLGVTLLEIILLNLFIGAILWAQGYFTAEVVQKFALQLRSEAEQKIHLLPLSYFDKQTRGEVLSKVTNDIGNISQVMQVALRQLLTLSLMLIGTVIMMIMVSPLLALVALATAPLALVLTRAIAKHSQRQHVARMTRLGEINGQMEEALSGHELIKVFGHQKQVIQRFEAKNQQLFEAGLAAQFLSSLMAPITMSIGSFSYVLVAVIGGMRVATGGMTLGAVQAFIQYLGSLNGPLAQLASTAGAIQSSIASAGRVFNLLDEPELRAEPERRAIAAARGHVEFQHVSFRYLPDKPLIEDLSLVAEPGHMVAIVGPTGAGKTTLVNLLLRFYELDQGRIMLDGVDIATMRRDDLRSRIGVVLQDGWLFKGTIRENIRYGRLDATDEEVLEVARATAVDRFVGGLAEGYDTVIDEESSNISAGQKQLITIARAFLRRPALLILDEATSSVDTRTEILVQRAMLALRAGRTSFVIAHRLSTIRDADLIVVMDDGRIIEQGTHEGLLTGKGAYYALYMTQFAAPEGEDERTQSAAAG